MHPKTMSAIIERKRYDTETATLVSGNDWWDGHNHERSGTQAFLYRTPRGRYFIARLTCWQGQTDSIQPVEQDEAIRFYETCDPHGTCRIEFEEAFPGVKVEEA